MAEEAMDTRGTPGMSFKREARPCICCLKTQQCHIAKRKTRQDNGRHLRYIHNNYTSTHFLRRNIIHAWYTREESFKRVKDVPLEGKSAPRIF